MVGLRKGSAYSRKHVVPYTRKSRKKSKAYIKSVPPQNVVKFIMGDEKLYDSGKLPFHITLIADEGLQIRSNALEACRQFINKNLETNFPGQYFFKVAKYPHHVQRENKMITGAGADRMQTGMQLSFGKPMGRAAILKKGDEIFFMALPNRKADSMARLSVNQIRSKLPGKKRVVSEEIRS